MVEDALEALNVAGCVWLLQAEEFTNLDLPRFRILLADPFVSTAYNVPSESSKTPDPFD